MSSNNFNGLHKRIDSIAAAIEQQIHASESEQQQALIDEEIRRKLALFRAGHLPEVDRTQEYQLTAIDIEIMERIKRIRESRQLRADIIA